jgi:hypothetical protein
LSATPIYNQPHEIALTMNLLRLQDKFDVKKVFYQKYIHENKVINATEFREKLRGYVSFYQGAHSSTFPKRNNKIVKCEMSKFQYKSYSCINSSEKSTISTLQNIPDNFFINSRSVSNLAFPNRKLYEKGFQSLVKLFLTKMNLSKLNSELQKYSMKYYKLMLNLNQATGTSFIYSNYVQGSGLNSIIVILNAYGYKNFYHQGKGPKRYALWTGDVPMNHRITAKNVFNLSKNKNGSLIQIILGSPAIKEGVSLLRLNQIHIVEPYWNTQLLEQVIGRGFRYCSHKDMPPKFKYIDVFYYISTYKNLKTVDSYIYEMAANKQNIIKQFEKLIKQASVDCWLNQNSNSKYVKCAFK